MERKVEQRHRYVMSTKCIRTNVNWNTAEEVKTAATFFNYAEQVYFSQPTFLYMTGCLLHFFFNLFLRGTFKCGLGMWSRGFRPIIVTG